MALYRHVGIEVTIGNVNNAVIPEETSEMDDPAITPPTQGHGSAEIEDAADLFEMAPVITPPTEGSAEILVQAIQITQQPGAVIKSGKSNRENNISLKQTMKTRRNKTVR